MPSFKLSPSYFLSMTGILLELLHRCTYKTRETSVGAVAAELDLCRLNK